MLDAPGVRCAWSHQEGSSWTLIRDREENVESEEVMSGRVGAGAQTESRSPSGTGKGAEGGPGEEPRSQGDDSQQSRKASRREGLSEKERAVNRAKHCREGGRRQKKRDGILGAGAYDAATTA